MSHENLSQSNEDQTVQPSLEVIREDFIGTLLHVKSELSNAKNGTIPKAAYKDLEGAMKITPEMTSEEREAVISEQHTIYMDLLHTDPDLAYEVVKHDPKQERVRIEEEAGPVEVTITRFNKLMALAEKVYVSEVDSKPLLYKPQLWIGREEHIEKILALQRAQRIGVET